MITSINDFKSPFFIGVAGVGMSAIAQYLKGIGKNVSGSDRFFAHGVHNEVQDKLEAANIKCFVQDGSGIGEDTDLIVVSTAIEDTVNEVKKAKELGIPIVRRSELLSIIAQSKKTIAVGGTSGKSTTSAMLFEILEYAKLDASIISGAGLTRIIKKGQIGNAKVGKGDWLVIEADESDGSIVQYKPDIGLLLNIDKDHQDLEELMQIFTVFKSNSEKFIVNRSHPLAQSLSQNEQQDFSTNGDKVGYVATDFKQEGFTIEFAINAVPFTLKAMGRHNMENALAATAVAHQIGVSLQTCAAALKEYEGIYRRNQILGNKNGVWLIDDYAHNPVKCAAAIASVQPLADKVIAWFQPHGYKPTKFLREEFVKEFAKTLRPQDELWMSEIYYAGGTALKDISANDLINDLKQLGNNAYYEENRANFVKAIRSHLSSNCVVLLMAARDPSLAQYAKDVWDEL
jgi:UDP-N-acetylmuramate--alanine ligase